MFMESFIIYVCTQLLMIGGSRCHMLKHFSICSLYESESLNTGKYKPRQHLLQERLDAVKAVFNPVVIVESDWERRNLTSSPSPM